MLKPFSVGLWTIKLVYNYFSYFVFSSVTRRLGDLNMRENFVIVFCLFCEDAIYCTSELLV